MRFVERPNFSSESDDRTGAVWHSMVRPCRVVKLLYVSDVPLLADLERPDDEVGRLLDVHQSHGYVAVHLLLVFRIWPVLLTLCLHQTQIKTELAHFPTFNH